MKIGIIIFSQTGNTLYVADSLKIRLNNMGQDVEIEKVEQVDVNNRDPKKIEIKSMPKLNVYDVLIFASPVQAFSLAGVFKDYLQKIDLINGIPSFCFVTKGINSKGFGGNKAIKTMNDIITEKGGTVKSTAIICWKNKDIRNLQTAMMIEDFSKQITLLK
ncbi:MAG: flavodoxin family protein [Eubacteriaceae bacterium]|nr:flavodoxin family protein [Eubacteriaceae bacterium]